MESAIPEHLRCPRTRTLRVEEDYTPSYPAYAARPHPSLKQIAVGCFGVQSYGPLKYERACATLRKTIEGFGEAEGPGHYDLAHFVDAAGYDNSVAIAYWDGPSGFTRWRVKSGFDAWWNSDERLDEGVGYFREFILPCVDHHETLFNTPDRLEGAGVVMGTVSPEIREHAYWGAMRDRIPLSQIDAMQPQGSLVIKEEKWDTGRRVTIRGHENVAVIRSGQEWTDTEGRERDLYLNDMEPVLREGMRFLRDQGNGIGCYSNRYMHHVDMAGRPLQKTFGLSYWRCLGDMERWSESHPTHVAIFGTFMRIVKELEFRLKLRVYHEVSILKADEQEYGYINCHPNTGMMAGYGPQES